MALVSGLQPHLLKHDQLYLKIVLTLSVDTHDQPQHAHVPSFAVPGCV